MALVALGYGGSSSSVALVALGYGDRNLSALGYLDINWIPTLCVMVVSYKNMNIEIFFVNMLYEP